MANFEVRKNRALPFIHSFIKYILSTEDLAASKAYQLLRLWNLWSGAGRDKNS